VPVLAVAFDLGGVLTHSPFAGLDDYCTRLGLPAGALSRYFRGDAQIARLEVGALTSRDFFKYVCIEAEAAHGQRIDIKELALAAAWGERMNPEMLELVADVHRRKRTGLLTNNVKEAGWREGFPTELFDVIVDSSAVGLRKPDPRIYALLLERLGRAPAEVVFVDDFEENLGPAAALGVQTVHFRSPAQCREALVDLGALEAVVA
jgi:epoxide hydrolase-like predicted phosphatase